MENKEEFLLIVNSYLCEQFYIIAFIYLFLLKKNIFNLQEYYYLFISEKLTNGKRY